MAGGVSESVEQPAVQSMDISVGAVESFLTEVVMHLEQTKLETAKVISLHDYVASISI